MKKFFVLYKAPIEEFQKAMTSWTPEERKESMAEWMKWMTDHKADLVDGGAPVGKTKQVRKDGVTDIKNDIGGYSIVQAESHDAATKIFADSPHLTRFNGSIEVMEIMEMPGM
jgi:hypothetical protein